MVANTMKMKRSNTNDRKVNQLVIKDEDGGEHHEEYCCMP